MTLNRRVCYGVETNNLLFPLAVASISGERPFVAFNSMEVTLPYPFCVFVGVFTLAPPAKLFPHS